MDGFVGWFTSGSTESIIAIGAVAVVVIIIVALAVWLAIRGAAARKRPSAAPLSPRSEVRAMEVSGLKRRSSLFEKPPPPPEPMSPRRASREVEVAKYEGKAPSAAALKATAPYEAHPPEFL